MGRRLDKDGEASGSVDGYRVRNLVELLALRARVSGEKRAAGLIDAEENLADSINFSGLDLRARAVGAWIARRGERGQRVMLALPTGVGYLEAFFGCLYAGAVAVPVFPPHPKHFKAARLNSIVADSGATLIFTTSSQLPAVARWLAATGTSAKAHSLEEVDTALAEAWVAPDVREDDIAFLQYTSGSTNVPKGVMVGHANLLHNMRLMRQRWSLSSESTIVSWLPLFHDLGIVGNNLLGVYLGATQYLMVAQDFVKRPGAWLRAISTWSAHIAMAPNFAFRLCAARVTQDERRELDLSRWKLAVNCGEPVVPSMAMDFVTAFKGCGFRSEAMTPALGMAETTLFVSGAAPDEISRVRMFDASTLRDMKFRVVDGQEHSARAVMSCGPVMDELIVRIVDPATCAVCADGEIGEIWVRGASVALGYWNNPTATADAFSVYTSDTGEGPFLRTGDLGFLYENELHVCGRLKNMIIVHGQNYFPTDIEVAIENCHPMLRRDFGVVFTIDVAGDERLVAVYEVAEDALVVDDIGPVRRLVSTVVADQFELQLHGLVLVERGTLPKTTSGKVRRTRTRDDLLEHSLSLVAQWLHPDLLEVMAADLPASPSPGETTDNHRRRPSVHDIETWLRGSVASLLSVPEEDVRSGVPFAAQGLGSLATAELAGSIERWLGRSVPSSIAYDYPSIVSLASHLAGAPARCGRAARPEGPPGAIAIVGLACRFPGADDVHMFWRNLATGIDSVTTAGVDRREVYSGSTVHGGFLKGVELFDPEFFGIAPPEAAAMDPQQRLLLEVAWEAVESAGVTLDRLGGSDTGVFVGISNNDYARLEYASEDVAGPYEGTGNAFSIAANRLSYLWDLRGPSMAVDTACSSSLVAVHMACRSLLAGECETALVGTVNLMLAPDLTDTFERAGMMSPAGRCRSFDDAADGYVRSEGCAAVLLKPLPDAIRDGDHIHAVISGSAINQDGRSNGLTAPNGPAQERVIRTALERAGVRSEEIDYVEAHGSGTPLGDPVEAGALSTVFSGRERPLLIGSVKTNIGHLEAAAGLAGLIKTVLALENELIPPSLHFDIPNHRVAWSQTRLEVCNRPRPWPRRADARKAGVTSFGFGGTNAHVVLEEAPAFASDATGAAPVQGPHLLVVSAKSTQALEALAGGYDHALTGLDAADLGAVCSAAAKGRTPFKERMAVVGESVAQLREHLAAVVADRHAPLCSRGRVKEAPRVACIFSGQGGAYPGMALELYQAFEPFRRRIDECVDWSERPGAQSLRAALLGDDSDALARSEIAQPALFAFQLALAELWRTFGVTPVAVCGHSIGEYAAACSAGMLAAEDALVILAGRGRLMDELAAPGGMLAVDADRDSLGPHLAGAEDVSMAAFNGPGQTVCAAPRNSLGALSERLRVAGMRVTEISVPHAFHSSLMRPMVAPFRALARGVPHAAASVPFVSCVTGRRIEPGGSVDGDYWADHVEMPVDFQAGFHRLLDSGVSHVLEIGPRPTLTALGQAMVDDGVVSWTHQPGECRSPLSAFLGALGRLFTAGVAINWSALDDRPSRHTFHLPTYPFQRRPFWNRKSKALPGMNTLNDAASSSPAPSPKLESGVDPDAIGLRLDEMIGKSLSIGTGALDRHSSFLEMGMDSISLIGVVRNIEREFGLRLEIRQMFESLFNLERLTAHVVANATNPARSEVPVASASCSAPAFASADATAIRHADAVVQSMTPPPGGAGAPGQGWEGLMARQLEVMGRLMQDQLQILGGPRPAGAPAERTMPAVSTPTLNPAMGRARSDAAPAIPMWKVAESSAAPLTPDQTAHLDELTRRYCERTRASKSYAQRHRKHLADNRVVAGFRALTKEMHYPLVSQAASGSRMWDIDGNEYIDVTMGFGVNLFGHNPPFVTDAIASQLSRGMQLGPQADLAGEVAELICELTGNERAAFVSTGTEAVMIACRLARAATGRDTIVVFNGAYHGQHDSTIAVTNPETGDVQAIPGVPGVSRNAVADTVMLNYDDPASLHYIAENANRLAAVLVEPVQSRRPELQPREFLHQLRDVTERGGVALIFDEMITGFRCHPGGAQGLFGVRADLVAYGKIVGGGLPIGVVSGRRRFMDVVDGGDWSYGDASWPSVQTTFVSGTHSKHPLTMAAARAVLQHLKDQGPQLQRRLDERTAAFANELNDYFTAEGLPFSVPHFSSIFRIAFAGNANLIYYHMLEKGVFLWEGRVYALSTAHSDEDLAQIIDAVKASVEELREGGFLPRGTRVPTAAPRVSAPARAAPTGARSAVARVGDAQRSEAAPTLDFSLSFFGRYEREHRDDKYDLLFAGARFADQHGFRAIWVPERHFHPFGGFSPNPSVTAAALARETSRIQIRAGSVVIPLHHPIRIAEEWALVDNLSHGRVGIAAASGWHPEDFVLAPEAYHDNREITFRHIETVQRLWSGEAVEAVGGTGKTFGATIYPMPKQATLPIWITVVKNPETYAEAGRRGLGVLTNMMGQTVEELQANVALYRQARQEAGHDPATGIVTVLVHAYVTDDADAARQEAAAPFKAYLSTMTGLLDSLARNHGDESNFASLSQEDRDYLLDATYRRYLETTALIGSPDSCGPIVESLRAAGANELACFVDFGVDPLRVVRSLSFLDELRARFSADRDVRSAAPADPCISRPAGVEVVEEEL